MNLWTLNVNSIMNSNSQPVHLQEIQRTSSRHCVNATSNWSSNSRVRRRPVRIHQQPQYATLHSPDLHSRVTCYAMICYSLLVFNYCLTPQQHTSTWELAKCVQTLFNPFTRDEKRVIQCTLLFDRPQKYIQYLHSYADAVIDIKVIKENGMGMRARSLTVRLFD